MRLLLTQEGADPGLCKWMGGGGRGTTLVICPYSKLNKGYHIFQEAPFGPKNVKEIGHILNYARFGFKSTAFSVLPNQCYWRDVPLPKNFLPYLTPCDNCDEMGFHKMVRN